MNYAKLLIASALISAVFLMGGSYSSLGGDENASVPDKERLDAAMLLLKAMKVDKTLEKSITNAVDIKIKQQPMLEPYHGVMIKFFAKYMSWESLKDETAAIYAGAFTLAELKKLTEFYNTPTGKKLAEKNPELMRQGSLLGMRKVQEHIMELRQMIAAEAARIAAEKKKGGVQ